MKSCKIRTAFLLGAGLGTRLRPLTDNLPKPLLPVGGRPLITYALDHCLTAGIERFIVNTYHCAGAYDDAFPRGHWRGAPILFRHEPILLDTAGGLKNIEDLLEPDETLLVYNGDILSDLPLSMLLAVHTAKGQEVTLALRSDGPLRNVALDASGDICDLRGILGNPVVRRCLFTGISIAEKRFMARLTPGKIASTIPVFAEMIREAPGSVGSVVIDAGTWMDIGDQETYNRIRAAGLPLTYEKSGGGPGAVEGHRLAGGMSDPAGKGPSRKDRGPGAPNQSGEGQPTCGLSGGAVPPSLASVPPRLAPGDAGGPAAAAASAVPDGEPEASGPETADLVRRTFGLPADAKISLEPVGKGGSDRAYFRVSAGPKTVILMRYGRMYDENDRYVAVASFLRQIGVRVPAIYAHDPGARLILMEDLGDEDLYALREAPWEVRRRLYEKTLALAAKLHAFSPDCLPAGFRLMPGFDANLYKWERDYFRDHCVRNVCRIELAAAEGEALETELAALAGRLAETPPSLVHRDLQSQNVMIVNGEPVLIDFQGLRPGSFFYDLGSLLFDPYVQFPEGERDKLLRFYQGLSGSRESADWFRELFHLASAQRLMQALGAYGFLGLKRGKPHFLAHIPRALDNLVAVTAEMGCLPRLHALAHRCCASVGK